MPRRRHVRRHDVSQAHRLASPADIAIFDCIRETLALPAISREGVLLACPKLNAWLGRMEDNVGLKAHLAQRGHAINVIAAGFGG